MKDLNTLSLRINAPILLLLIAISISSCTIEKRHYQQGYHMEWNNSGGNSARKTHSRTNSALSQNNVKPISNTKSRINIDFSDNKLSNNCSITSSINTTNVGDLVGSNLTNETITNTKNSIEPKFKNKRLEKAIHKIISTDDAKAYAFLKSNKLALEGFAASGSRKDLSRFFQNSAEKELEVTTVNNSESSNSNKAKVKTKRFGEFGDLSPTGAIFLFSGLISLLILIIYLIIIISIL